MSTTELLPCPFDGTPCLQEHFSVTHIFAGEEVGSYCCPGCGCQVMGPGRKTEAEALDAVVEVWNRRASAPPSLGAASELEIAQAEYIKFLGDDIGQTAALLDVHGYRTSKEQIERGEALRARITALAAMRAVELSALPSPSASVEAVESEEFADKFIEGFHAIYQHPSLRSIEYNDRWRRSVRNGLKIAARALTRPTPLQPSGSGPVAWVVFDHTGRPTTASIHERVARDYAAGMSDYRGEFTVEPCTPSRRGHNQGDEIMEYSDQAMIEACNEAEQDHLAFDEACALPEGCPQEMMFDGHHLHERNETCGQDGCEVVEIMPQHSRTELWTLRERASVPEGVGLREAHVHESHSGTSCADMDSDYEKITDAYEHLWGICPPEIRALHEKHVAALSAPAPVGDGGVIRVPPERAEEFGDALIADARRRDAEARASRGPVGGDGEAPDAWGAGDAVLTRIRQEGDRMEKVAREPGDALFSAEAVVGLRDVLQDAAVLLYRLRTPSPVVSGEAPASVWQPMETAPRDGTNVLLFTTNYGIVQAWYSPSTSGFDHEGNFDGEGAVWVIADDALQIEVEDYAGENGEIDFFDGTATGWQPLPAAPVSGSAQPSEAVEEDWLCECGYRITEHGFERGRHNPTRGSVVPQTKEAEDAAS